MKKYISPSSLKPDRIRTANGVTVYEYLLKDHNENGIALPPARTEKLHGVVIHNTLPAGTADDARQYTAATLNDNMESRTHYYVTDTLAWQDLPEYSMNWTCGDGMNGKGNGACISLEIIMDSVRGEKNIRARDNGARLAAYILRNAGLTVNDMYTHNYFLNVRNGMKGTYERMCISPAPTRNCPYYLVRDWDGFRRQTDEYIKALGGRSVYDGTPEGGTRVQTVYRAVSRAAVRSGMFKTSPIRSRVFFGGLYPADRVYDGWFRHAGKQEYSMLKDGYELFENAGTYRVSAAPDKMTVRALPDPDAEVIHTAEKGENLYIMCEASVRYGGQDWKKVIVNSRTGYAVIP